MEKIILKIPPHLIDEFTTFLEITLDSVTIGEDDFTANEIELVEIIKRFIESCQI